VITVESYNISIKENGKLVLNNMEIDFLLIPATTIEKIGESLYKIVGPAASVHLREIGRGIGKALTEVIIHERKDNSAREDVNAIATYLEKAGFGKIEVKEHGDYFDILIKNPPSLRYKAEGVQKCTFEAGLIRGVMEALTSQKWRAEVDNKVNNTCCLIHLKRA
jgi:predicted hydrocarbon binding protein